MNKLFKFFMFWAIPLLAVMVVSCKDDEDPTPVVQEPAITSVTPGQGAVGTAVTITGTNLEDVTRVTFGGVNAEGFDPDDNTATTITAAVPAGLTAGAQNITVTSAGGSATANFTVVEGTVTPGTPVITSFNPTTGPIGTEVTITGTDLDVADSAYIGDARITDWEANDLATEATFTIPQGAETGAFVLYHGEDASGVESATDFTVEDGATGEAPVITSFSPASGPVGTEMTITGSNLDQADSAYIGDVAITDWEVAEDGNSATFTIPEGAETGSFVLYHGAEATEVESADTFTVGEPFSTITSFEPVTGAVGQSVTITGTNLNMATSARIGDVDITDWEAAEDGTSATFTIPEGATTNVITLENAEGARVVSTEEFTVGDGGTGENLVFVSSFTPVAGPAATEVTVAISEADQVTSFTGATSVMIGETEILAENYTIAEDGRSIAFTVPEGAASGNVIVQTPQGTFESDNMFAVGTPNAIFEDALAEGWQIWDGWGNTTNDPASTAIEGTTAIEVNYTEAYGGFQLHPEPVIALEGDESIMLSIYGAEGAGDVMIYVKDATDPADEDKVTLPVVEGEWRTYVVPVSQFTNNPANINELVIQNRDVATNTIYIDNVTLVQ